MSIKDVTAQVETGDPDGETIPLNKCVCGAEFEYWGFTISVYPEHPEQCPVCGRKLYAEIDIKVFEAVE